jgi:hypothetical protein
MSGGAAVVLIVALLSAPAQRPIPIADSLRAPYGPAEKPRPSRAPSDCEKVRSMLNGRTPAQCLKGEL